MILVDYRTGSKDFAPQLTDAGLENEVTTLEFGDLAFFGRGINETQVFVGIEFKQLGDLLTSLRDGRLPNHQIPGMLKRPGGQYDFGWLIFEGEYRTDPSTGLLLTPRKTKNGREWKPAPGNWNTAELEKRLLSLTMEWGLHVRHFTNRDQVLRFLHTLYHWWTDVALDKHKSTLVEHRVSSWRQMSPMREAMAGRWPHVGRSVSKAVEAKFGSLVRAANASVTEWASIEVVSDSGRVSKLGIKRAEEIVAFLRGGAK